MESHGRKQSSLIEEQEHQGFCSWRNCAAKLTRLFMKQLLQKLTNEFSPSGYEDAIRTVIRNEVKGIGGEVRVDTLGNLIVRIGQSSKNGKRIMVAAHMDEIGLM